MNRKSVLAVLIVLSIICHGIQAQEGPAADVKITTKEVYSPPNVPYCFARGIVNVGTCPLEVPRCMIYDNAKIPVIGLVGGAVEGTFLTIARAFSGIGDIISLGFSEGGLYSERFPDFIWNSKWLPSEKQIIIEKTIEREKAPQAK